MAVVTLRMVGVLDVRVAIVTAREIVDKLDATLKT